MASSGESWWHPPQSARAASDALSSASAGFHAESCGQPLKPFSSYSDSGENRRSVLCGGGYSTVTITGNINVAVSLQRPSRPAVGAKGCAVMLDLLCFQP